MKQLLIIISALLLTSACNQAKPEVTSITTTKKDTVPADTKTPRFNQIRYTINADSIDLKHTAKFSKTENKEDEVTFTLKITNKGTTIIPTIQTARWHSHLQIYINGQSAMFMTLANMSFGDDQSLVKDSADVWDFPVTVTGPNAADYGEKFTYQWKYNDIASGILEVDIIKRKIRKVNQHIKNDKTVF